MPKDIELESVLEAGQGLAPPIWEASPAWVGAALNWIHARLHAAGRRVTGPAMLVRRFPWALVLTAPTDRGAVFFKAVAPDGMFEVRITQALAQWEPELTLPLLGVDLERRWFLTPDGGHSLRTAIRSRQSIAPWFDLLPQYAAFQQRLAARLDDLRCLGAPDQGLAALPGLYADLLAGRDWLRLDQEDGLSLAQFERLQAMAGRVEVLCAELAAYGLPETLNQSDLNDANIFYNDGRFTLYDWGDSSLGHPFLSLRVPRVSMEISLDWSDFDPRGEPPVRAYLRAWTEQTGLDEALLWQAYRLSQPLASLSRAVEWRRGLHSPAEAEQYGYRHVVPALLQEFMELA